jgi:eukaryotic-like serine/threonine-protein kinase
MPASATGQVLLSQLRADVSRRWRSGDPVRVESYLEQYPHLAANADAVLELIGTEFLVRDEHGDTPGVEEFAARFPQHADAIRRRWAILRLLARGGTLADPTPQDSPAPPRELPQVAGYEILEEIGHGGMGVVYKARQTALDRVVALKLIRERHREGEGAARFRTEAQAVGRLRHPHVVAAFSFEQSGGWLALAMEYLPGGNLAALLKAGPLDPRRAAQLASQIAQGLQAAHEAGVVHRDLKPANVLLAEDGSARVADFGLARLLDSDESLTAHDAVLGTPAYMAPEQAAGLAREVGPAADVWALGAILYHCLTGRPPFRGETPYQTLQQVRTASLTPPRSLRADVPADLDVVCRKCLQREPGQRYASAAEAAADLERFLSGEKVRTRVAPAWPGGRSTVWRAAVVACAVALSVAVGFALWRQFGGSFASAPEVLLERDLKLDKPTQLIGTGQPRVARPIVGVLPTKLTTDEDGHFAVVSTGLCMLELAADPMRDAYRLRAQIRHLRYHSGPGRIGLYVGHKSVLRQPNPVHQFTMITFNDVVDEVKQFIEESEENGVKADPPKGNYVHALPTVFAGAEWKEGSHSHGGGSSVPLFKAHGAQNGDWRTLTVEVRPTGVKVFWETPAARLPAGELTARQVRDGLTTALKGLAEAEFLPRGGLGLYVERSDAAFRNVVVEPLEP